ncbi:MAG: hypothetical protein FWG73_08455 [Planctomycetaceae bacterium]|nr:hypothetical protein [Planctomycetaceae bacterium]
MKRKHIFILTAIIVVNVIAFFSLTNWRTQKQEQARVILQDATRYDGATGPTIAAFDDRTRRWIAELEEEPIEEILRKLTDAAEYTVGYLMASDGLYGFHDEEWRNRSFYRPVIEAILSNRRFRAAYENLKNTNRRQAAEMLSLNIRENLAVLRIMLQEDIDKIARGEHKDTDEIILVPLSTSLEDGYRPMAPPDTPPTRTGRRYAIFSYIWLASLLELREVRTAIEEVIQFAKEEYELFNRVDTNEANQFKNALFGQSLYNPSLFLTATLADPAWNADKHRLLEAKLVTREIVDYQARALEHDRYASQGLVPVVPHGGMITVRYYIAITDEEFNDFFR